MDMLNLTKSSLDSHQALTPAINSHIAKVMSAIPYNIPQRMKAVIAQAQVTTFASQFRRNLKLWDDTSVPVNSISFVITGSGDGKDSSVKAARKCFTSGYDMLEQARKATAIKHAQTAAREAGEQLYTDPDVYKQYLKPLPPIDIRPTTGPGFIQHVNDLGEHQLGSGALYSGEFADELAYNQDMLENIKILSELYDVGDLDTKYTKSIENRSRAVTGQPVSALLVSSPSHILHDEGTKKKFTVAFMSKLARRSWFCFTPERMPKPDFTSIDDMLAHEFDIEQQAKSAREAMKTYINRVAEFGISTAGNDIGVTEDVFKLFKTYLRYNSELADTYPNQHSTAVLVRRHLQWKALKLAGALAIFDLSNDVQASHYIDAIRFCELLADDISLFEAQLNKSEHERMADFLHTTIQTDGKAFITTHELKKRGFTIAITKSKLQELATLANAYDSSGIYSVPHDASGIAFESIVKADTISISFKPINLSKLDQALTTGDKDLISKAKSDIAATTAYGYECADTTFADLSNLLQGAYAYSPFKFTNGIRGKDHISGGTSWLVFDLDDSPISAESTHFMLQDINHHIALGSDPSNPFKFRCLIQLDSVVDISSLQWKHFYAAVASDLALHIDQLPQSQIFFSYPDRPIYSTLDASPLPVKDYLLISTERVNSKPSTATLSTPQRKALLSDPTETFAYAFNAPMGAGSRSLIRAALHAKDLGATKDEIITLVTDINEYWDHPLDINRLDNTIIKQISGWF